MAAGRIRLPNKSLDASGSSLFLNQNDPAERALMRAAAVTQPFARIAMSERRSGSDAISAQLEWIIPSLPLRVLTQQPRGIPHDQKKKERHQRDALPAKPV
jgi:hypothetical protein